eukprot:13195269-Alexandrium_andersonii.AAC.1
MALSAAPTLQKFRAPPHNADPSAGGAARNATPPTPASGERGSAAERAVWPVVRAGTATSRVGF